jgi:hypothetical protein
VNAAFTAVRALPVARAALSTAFARRCNADALSKNAEPSAANGLLHLLVALFMVAFLRQTSTTHRSWWSLANILTSDLTHVIQRYWQKEAAKWKRLTKC